MDYYFREIKMIADSLAAISSPVPLHNHREYTIIRLGGSGNMMLLLLTLLISSDR